MKYEAELPAETWKYSSGNAAAYPSLSGREIVRETLHVLQRSGTALRLAVTLKALFSPTNIPPSSKGLSQGSPPQKCC